MKNDPALNFLSGHIEYMYKSFYSVLEISHILIVFHCNCTYRQINDRSAELINLTNIHISNNFPSYRKKLWVINRSKKFNSDIKRILNKPTEDNVEDIRPCNPDLFGHHSG